MLRSGELEKTLSVDEVKQMALAERSMFETQPETLVEVDSGAIAREQMRMEGQWEILEKELERKWQSNELRDADLYKALALKSRLQEAQTIVGSLEACAGYLGGDERIKKILEMAGGGNLYLEGGFLEAWARGESPMIEEFGEKDSDIDLFFDGTDEDLQALQTRLEGDSTVKLIKKWNKIHTHQTIEIQMQGGANFRITSLKEVANFTRKIVNTRGGENNEMSDLDVVALFWAKTAMDQTMIRLNDQKILRGGPLLTSAFFMESNPRAVTLGNVEEMIQMSESENEEERELGKMLLENSLRYMLGIRRIARGRAFNLAEGEHDQQHELLAAWMKGRISAESDQEIVRKLVEEMEGVLSHYKTERMYEAMMAIPVFGMLSPTLFREIGFRVNEVNGKHVTQWGHKEGDAQVLKVEGVMKAMEGYAGKSGVYRVGDEDVRGLVEEGMVKGGVAYLPWMTSYVRMQLERGQTLEDFWQEQGLGGDRKGFEGEVKKKLEVRQCGHVTEYLAGMALMMENESAEKLEAVIGELKQSCGEQFEEEMFRKLVVAWRGANGDVFTMRQVRNDIVGEE